MPKKTQTKKKLVKKPDKIVMPTLDKPVAVVVTTEYRGVFFGYTYDVGYEVHGSDCVPFLSRENREIILLRMRNCLRWSAEVKGFEGLAATGPTSDCRVGPQANAHLTNVTCVLECSPEAVAAWERAPWAEE